MKILLRSEGCAQMAVGNARKQLESLKSQIIYNILQLPLKNSSVFILYVMFVFILTGSHSQNF